MVTATSFTSPVEEPAGTLSGNLVRFGRILCAAGINATVGRLVDAGRSLTLVSLADREDVRAALRANLISDHAQAALFDRLFDSYWRDAGDRSPALPVVPPEDRGELGQRAGGAAKPVAAVSEAAYAPQADNPEATAGGADLLTMKDFAGYTADDLDRARRLVRAIAPKLASARSRRQQPSLRCDEIDLRRSLRHAAQYGGEVLRLLRRRRRVRRLRLVLLCDVSGSMDLYSRQLIQFLFAAQNELRGVSTFVFSTRLNEVTHLLKTRSYDEALARVQRDVEAWSGGTGIGRCLLQFERQHGPRRVDSRTAIVIISDGWERGDLEPLGTAMIALKRRARRIVWLNPLLGQTDYRPVARGMAAALPYVDDFLPAHNLGALARAVRALGDSGGRRWMLGR